jgi:L-ascorbate metabolism protein UlaG (beta-lactamase superfamily)
MSVTTGTGGLRITYVGHATVLLDLDGVRIVTDPVLRSRVFHLRRIVPRVSSESLGPIDGILISHAHWDHLDLPSLRTFDRAVPVIAPRGNGALLRRLRFAEVSEVDIGESTMLGAVRVLATPADHDGRRGPLGVRASALGFVVEGSKRAYFAGDTDLFDEMASIGGGLDAALIPVAGWGKKLGPGHLDAARAAEAASLLRPQVAVPIHWGTFRPVSERGDPGHPETEFRDRVAKLAPEVTVRILAPGETLDLR